MPAQDETQAAGYQALVGEFGLTVMPLPFASYTRRRGAHGTETSLGQTTQYFPASYAPEPTTTAQLEFALKYDGVNLEVLRGVFELVDPARLAGWIRGKPTGKYTRRAWFLYEWLTGKTLDVPDAPSVAYVDALGADRYFVASAKPSPRHAVRDDLPGVRSFCPLVRRTESLAAFMAKDLRSRLRTVASRHGADVLHRAAQFLYLKETKSSFEIERENPDRRRTLKFVELLRAAGAVTELDKQAFVALQKAILDTRYATEDYRSDQTYVGQTLPGYREQVHYVSPKPGDVEELMRGLISCSSRLADSQIDPVVQAAILGFGFVFIHPFDDGNGRLHRYLIHQVLSRAGFTPSGFVLPVSAVMLADPRAYDACLETFSRPLLERLDYELDAKGALSVRGESVGWYRYFDATPAAEYLFAVVERTIDRDLAGELDYLARFDAAWPALREIVDLPDRRLDLFLKLCLGNHGRLSARKRAVFAELSDEEVSALERVVQDAGLGRDR